MWLLNTESRRLEFFSDEWTAKGGYAILSHRWGEEEVTFDEIHLEEAKEKRGYQKIEYARNQATKDAYRYVWIDTCCIDKRSSAELSEAINSMFRWYQNAGVCYVYMSDFEYDYDSPEMTQDGFSRSRWWSRGWTLQELIAPSTVLFFDKKWRYYSDKVSLRRTIYNITDIDAQVLQSSKAMHTMSVAKRMSWASKRSTSREEDQAYALLGIFNVNMPLLYGEGGSKAFYRLQEEIIRTMAFADHSILAWMSWEGPPFLLTTSSSAGHAEPDSYQNLLSPSPYGFRYAQRIVSWSLPQLETFTLTSSGLHLSLLAQKLRLGSTVSSSITAILNCRYEDDRMSHIVLCLDQRLRVTFRTGQRLKSIATLEPECEKLELTLAREPFMWPLFQHKVHIRPRIYLDILETFPANAFDKRFSMLSLTTSLQRYHANMNPAYGALVMGRDVPVDRPIKPFVLTIDCWTAGNNSPQIHMGVFNRSDVQDLHNLPLRNTWSVETDRSAESRLANDFWVKVSARCAIVSGGLFWILDIDLGTIRTSASFKK